MTPYYINSNIYNRYIYITVILTVLYQYNEEATRKNSILDLVIANESLPIEEFITDCPLGYQIITSSKSS